MRTLSSTLESAQQKKTLSPLVKIVLTSGATTYTYEQDRISSISHEEEPYRHSAEVTLDNSDGALTGLDFKGWKAVISYGLVTKAGAEYSATAPLWVVHQELNSSPGKLTCELRAVGIPNLLAEDRANDSYLPTNADTKTVKTLIREIAGDTGVTQLACYNHGQAYDTVWETGYDALADTYIPKDGFRIDINGSRLAAIRRPLGYTKNVIRFENDGKLHILKPTTTGTTYDYEYSLETGHCFFAKAYRKSLVIPNYIVVKSNSKDDPQYSGSAQDAESYALIPKRQYRRTRLQSNAEATSIAEAIIFNFQLNAQMGAFSCPINVGQELYDYVRVVDARENDERTGNIGSIRRQYSSE